MPLLFFFYFFSLFFLAKSKVGTSVNLHLSEVPFIVANTSNRHSCSDHFSWDILVSMFQPFFADIGMDNFFLWQIGMDFLLLPTKCQEQITNMPSNKWKKELALNTNSILQWNKKNKAIHYLLLHLCNGHYNKHQFLSLDVYYNWEVKVYNERTEFWTYEGT